MEERINLKAEEWNKAVETRILRGKPFEEIKSEPHFLMVYQAIDGFIKWRGFKWHVSAWTPPSSEPFINLTRIERVS